MAEYVLSEPKIDRYQGAEGPIIRTEVRVVRAETGEPVAILFSHIGDLSQPVSDKSALSMAHHSMHRTLVALVEQTGDWGDPKNIDLNFHPSS